MCEACNQAKVLSNLVSGILRLLALGLREERVTSH